MRVIVLLSNQPINQFESSYVTSAPLLSAVHKSTYIYKTLTEIRIHLRAPSRVVRVLRDIGSTLGASHLWGLGAAGLASRE